jgi:hypothetical protein
MALHKLRSKLARERRAAQQLEREEALLGLRFEFVNKSWEYTWCRNPGGKAALVHEIDGILDHHTQVEAAIGLAEIEEAIRTVAVRPNGVLEW